MDFLEDPGAIAALDRAALAVLLAKAASLQGAIFARLLASDAQSTATDTIDKLLTVEQASEILAVSKSWLYNRGKKLGLAVKLGDGTLRFSSAALQCYMRANRQRQ